MLSDLLIWLVQQVFCLPSGRSWLLTRHQLSTSPELNSKSDLIFRIGAVEKGQDSPWMHEERAVQMLTPQLMFCSCQSQWRAEWPEWVSPGACQNEAHIWGRGGWVPHAETPLVSLMRSPLTQRGPGWLSVKGPNLVCSQLQQGDSASGLFQPWLVPAVFLTFVKLHNFVCSGYSPYKLCVITLFDLWKIVWEP